jgi:hypothetical protein
MKTFVTKLGAPSPLPVKELAVNKPWIAATHLAETP